jgi:dTDP-4-dehydrorhamnose reductase
LTNNRLKIIILGANGMIGHKLYQVISKYYLQTYALIRGNSISLNYRNLYNEKYLLEGVDLSDFQKLDVILNNIKPDVIINAAGITIRRGVEIDVKNTLVLNSLFPKFLANWCNLNSGWLIHLSTDCVFSGTKGNYSELDFPDARDLYGLTKNLGENSINALVIRGSFIGRELANYTELLEWFLRTENKSIIGYNKVLYSGISTPLLAEYIIMVMKNYYSLKGLFNVSSIPISKYNLLCLFNNNFNRNIDIIKSDDYESNKVLNSSLFFNLIGVKQPCWQDMIVKLKEDSILNKNYYNK